MKPFSRINMLSLKKTIDEENNTKKIETFVSQTYELAVHFAEIHSDTQYRRNLNVAEHYGPGTGHYGVIHAASNVTPRNGYQQMGISYDDVVRNMDEILLRLRNLFPECVVEYKKITSAKGMDGKDYDISTIDEKLRPFIYMNNTKTEEFILIDWS